MLKLKELLLDDSAEKSAGAIIYHCSDKTRFLLLFGDKIGWGFPKGHIDKNETKMETAKREIEEETGIIIDEFLPNFEESVHYLIHLDYSKIPPEPLEIPINKVVTYYLAEVDSKDVKLSHEHDTYKWVTYKEAKELLQFNLDILKKANKLIKWQKKK